MSAQPPADQGATAPLGETRLWVERRPDGTSTGFSSRGARVDFGPNTLEGAFTPGELLKLALAACTGGSVARVFAAHGSTEPAITLTASGQSNAEAHRYETIAQQIDVAAQGISAEDIVAIERELRAVIDSRCTLVRTLRSGAAIQIAVNIQSAAG